MSPKDLIKELHRAHAEIERLKKENQKLKLQIQTSPLRTQKSSNESFGTGSIDDSSTREDKVRFFRNLFKTRDDVYAVRWTNRSGRSGYSPACYYEWDPVICKKPNGKCDNCKYIPIDDVIIRKHLSGKQVIGVYPLLKDETCWFLAVEVVYIEDIPIIILSRYLTMLMQMSQC